MLALPDPVAGRFLKDWHAGEQPPHRRPLTALAAPPPPKPLHVDGKVLIHHPQLFALLGTSFSFQRQWLGEAEGKRRTLWLRVFFEKDRKWLKFQVRRKDPVQRLS